MRRFWLFLMVNMRRIWLFLKVFGVRLCKCLHMILPDQKTGRCKTEVKDS